MTVKELLELKEAIDNDFIIKLQKIEEFDYSEEDKKEMIKDVRFIYQSNLNNLEMMVKQTSEESNGNRQDN